MALATARTVFVAIAPSARTGELCHPCVIDAFGLGDYGGESKVFRQLPNNLTPMRLGSGESGTVVCFCPMACVDVAPCASSMHYACRMAWAADPARDGIMACVCQM